MICYQDVIIPSATAGVLVVKNSMLSSMFFANVIIRVILTSNLFRLYLLFLFAAGSAAEYDFRGLEKVDRLDDWGRNQQGQTDMESLGTLPMDGDGKQAHTHVFRELETVDVLDDFGRNQKGETNLVPLGSLDGGGKQAHAHAFRELETVDRMDDFGRNQKGETDMVSLGTLHASGDGKPAPARSRTHWGLQHLLPVIPSAATTVCISCDTVALRRPYAYSYTYRRRRPYTIYYRRYPYMICYQDVRI
jgi:hypothetical protein